MRRLWPTLISGICILSVITASPNVELLSAPTMPAKAESHLDGDPWEHVNKTCLTANYDCNEALNLQHLRKLERYMNVDIDPCVNFYEYACGNWQSENEDHQSAVKNFVSGKVTQNLTELFETWLAKTKATTFNNQKSSDRLVGMLLRNIPDRSEEVSLRIDTQSGIHPILVDKMLHYYRVCRSDGIVGFDGLDKYFEQMHRDNLFDFNSRNWQDNLAYLARLGYSEHFLRMQVRQRNDSYYSMALMPHIPLSVRHMQIDVDVLFVLIRKKFNYRNYGGLISKFKELERNLWRIQSTACGHGEPIENCDSMKTYSIEQLEVECNVIKWKHCLSILMSRDIQPNDLVWVEDIGKIKAIALYLEEADPELLFLYTIVRFLGALKRHTLYISKDYDVSNNFKCIGHMRKLFHFPMTYLYERAFYSSIRKESELIVSRVFEQLKNEFRNTLRRNRMQFTESALQHMLAKLDSLRLNLGNLPTNVTDKFFLDYVSGLQLTDDFYLNHLRALQHFYTHQHRLAELSAQNESIRSIWLTFNLHSPDFPDIIEASPYYFALSNMVIVPHAYLQPPFFHREFWPALLFGDLATTLGHEIIHAFDNNFIHYDFNGNMIDDKDIEENPKFIKNLKCLDLETNFVAERIADISGTRLAIDAFASDNKFMRENGKLFFFQFAQFFCSTNVQNLDPYHDPGSIRLNYTVAHTPAFAEVFNCPLASPMNPSQRCAMW